MSQFESVLCPVCNSNNPDYIAHYKNGERTFLGVEALFRCVLCGLVFAWPMPPDDVLDKHYRDSVYYEDKNPYARHIYEFSYQLARSRLRLMLRYLPAHARKRWLDIGAGNAVLGQALREMQPDAEYHAVEPSAICRRGWGNWVSAAYDDLSGVPFEAYDVIVLNQVLEHVNSPLRFLEDVAQHLVRGGYLYIDVPHRDDLFKPSIEPHLLFWEKGSLSYLVERAGLSIVFCDSAGMKWPRARRFFDPKLIDKLADPWLWIIRMNKALARLGVEYQFSSFGRFQADTYGGERQWLRCIAKKAE